MTDETLVELLFAHEETALEALTAQYGPYCRTVAGRILTDGRDVEECLNDCWLTVWNAIPPARPEHFRGWLGAVVRNRAIAIGKRNSRLAPLAEETALELARDLSPDGDGPRLAEARALGEAISAFLRRQKPDLRRAFLRRYWGCGSIEEIAGELGWSTSKTKSALFRTRNSLKDFLKKEGHL